MFSCSLLELFNVFISSIISVMEDFNDDSIIAIFFFTSSAFLVFFFKDSITYKIITGYFFNFGATIILKYSLQQLTSSCELPIESSSFSSELKNVMMYK